MAIQALSQARTGLRRLFRPLNIAASGMNAQSRRIDAIAQNLANVETFRTPEGGPYRRKVVNLQSVESASGTFGTQQGVAQTAAVAFQDLVRPDGVRVAGVTEDTTPASVYMPGHPDADAAGFVPAPNVTIEEELADLMDAKRAFEANATMFQVAKAVLRRSLEI